VTLLGYEYESQSPPQQQPPPPPPQQYVRQSNVVVGLPSPRVQEETGGIFLGLMAKDDHRPAFLQQFPFRSFHVDFVRNTLTLLLDDEPNVSISADDDADDNDVPRAMDLFDFRPYGPDLYHYGVRCDRIQISFTDDDDDNERTIDVAFRAEESSVRRPLVAVFDTGLSGCILSDTLWDEIQDRLPRQDDRSTLWRWHPTGCTVSLCPPPSPPNRNGLVLSSTPDHWRFQSFRLPWWYADRGGDSDNGGTSNNNDNPKSASALFPHVIVMGSTFWRNQQQIQGLCIDTVGRRATILTT
jgi:hypothetical protein